jgi:hypothetical protein
MQTKPTTLKLVRKLSYRCLDIFAQLLTSLVSFPDNLTITSDLERLVIEAASMKHFASWYYQCLGLQVTEASKGKQGVPQFLNREVKKLYADTRVLVKKLAASYRTVDQLRAALTPPNWELTQDWTEPILNKYGSAIWGNEGHILAEPVHGDPDYTHRLLYRNDEDCTRSV